MKRTGCVLCLILVLAGLLLGCQEEPDYTMPTVALKETLPSFREELTPMEQLQAAAEKTRQASAMSLQCTQTSQAGDVPDTMVTRWDFRLEDGEYTALYASYALGSDGAPTDRVDRWYEGTSLYEKDADGVTQHTGDGSVTAGELFADLGGILDNDAIFTTLCSKSLMVSPSNDGSFRFQATNLTQEEFDRMLYGDALSPWQTEQNIYTAAATIDAQGYLSELEFTVEASDGSSLNLLIRMTQIDDLPELTPPQWVSDANEGS